jgi:hypothetical protein
MRPSIIDPILASMLALTLTMPAFSQSTAGVDQQVRQKAEAIVTQYVEALNKGDGQAHAALFTPNGIEINPFGKHRVTEAQAQENVDLPHNLGLILSAKADDVEPLSGGRDIVVTAPFNATFTKNPDTPQARGNLFFVLERAGAGDDWKIRVVTSSRLAANAPAK